MLTEVRPEKAKAMLPIDVTLVKFIDVKELQLLKELLPNVVTVEGKLTVAKFVHPTKQLSGIIIIPESERIVTLVILVLD